MGRPSHTRKLIETNLGQHLALSVAAHLARTQLVPDSTHPYDSQHLADMVSLVANALAKVATLYVRDMKAGDPRELTAAELEGATARNAATQLVLKDGRTLGSVSIKRGDLRQAIAILRATGIPNLLQPPSPVPQVRKPQTPILHYVADLEALLRQPLVASRVEKAKTLSIVIARGSRQGKVANLAMELMTALNAGQEGESGLNTIRDALAKLRAAAEEVSERNN